jgi:ribosome biogenesis protein Nip4
MNFAENRLLAKNKDTNTYVKHNAKIYILFLNGETNVKSAKSLNLKLVVMK